MQQYILRRSFQSIIALFLLSIIVFGVVRLTGDPSYLLVDESASEEQRLEIRRGLGLDRPFVVQYGIFIGNFLKGDLGRSVRGRTPVTDLLADRLMPSVNERLRDAAPFPPAALHPPGPPGADDKPPV